MEAELINIHKSLLKNKPDAVNFQVRKNIFSELDVILKDKKKILSSELGKFFRLRIETALREIKKEKVASGLTIWQFYGSGYVIKTSSCIFGVDIIEGIENICMNKEQKKHLVSLLDMLFITHTHYDHLDVNLVLMMLKAEKKVYMPEDIWYSLPRLKENIIDKKHRLKINVFVGHQNPYCLNNVYSIQTKENDCIMHCGDQNDREIFTWLTKNKTDILLFSSVLPKRYISDFIRFSNPKEIVVAHCHEIGHLLRGYYTSGYIEALDLLSFLNKKLVVLAWGEKYHYKTNKS